MAPRFQIEQVATRDDAYVKIAVMGPSGAGKTYSSLVIATGMCKDFQKKHGRKAKVLLADTEKGRGKYYADEFEYGYCRFDAPYSPEAFIELINYAVEQKYDILIIDSASHEWDGEGGCLELHHIAGGTYQAWGKITPRHNAFIEAIAYSPIHIIATMRGKDQYEVEKDEKGKTNVKKLGLGARQRDGFEYDFTCSFMLDQKTHTVDVEKDTTHVFDNRGAFILTEKDGEKLMEWATSGNGKTPDVRKIEPVQPEEDINDLKKEIVNLCVELGGTKNEALMTELKKVVPNGNPNSIRSVEKAKALLEILKGMKG